MTAPLEGIRVVEIASFVAAPSAGALLADLGADVIKVEVPEGELYRHTRPRMNGFKSDIDVSPAFEMDNRGKRSLALDLTRPEALEALLRVIDGADVVLTTLLPGRQKRFRLDPLSLRARKPALVHATLNGYGTAGAEADRPAFDYTAYWARTGMMDLMRAPDAVPAFLRPGVGDHAAGMSLVAGILAALRVRDRTGQGQAIDVSLLQIGCYIQGNDLAQSLAVGESPPMHDRREPRNPLWNLYPTSDGRWLMLVMVDTIRYWPAVCRALGREDLVADPRFAGPVERYKSSRELVAIFDEIFLSRTLADWETALEKAGIIWSAVRHMHEVADDPQARAMGYFPIVEHPRAGPMPTVGPPFRMSDFAMRANRPAPELGSDSADVLREAGLSDDEIAKLVSPSPVR
jgi:crotonobetainyl-CoA:carnitine CoA-transferase CaiB-like acyl-CoA transferase